MISVIYKKKTVFDYVMGNDIDGYDIDDLENDYRFMIEVIKFTKDKNIYNLCSDKVKDNYEFVRFLVDFFKDDSGFVVLIVKDYLNKLPSDDIRARELLILVSNIISDDEDIALDFGIRMSGFYQLEKFKISYTLNNSENISDCDEYGMGFVFILESYGSSKIITDYFAKRFIKEIFYDNKVKFEELIHGQYKDVSAIEGVGINNFIIKYINSFDSYLANYVETNIMLIDDVKKDLVNVINNWDKYLDKLNSDRCIIFYEELFQIVDNYGGISGYCYDDISNYVIDKLGLKNIFDKYYNEDEELKLDIKIRHLEREELNLLELKCLSDIMRMAVKLFSIDVIDRGCYDYCNFYNDGKNAKRLKKEILGDES